MDFSSQGKADRVFENAVLRRILGHKREEVMKERVSACFVQYIFFVRYLTTLFQ
jgi:hypothetical protein